MKKLLAIVALLAMTTMTTNAMSYEQARQQALFLTDKMAYELNLTEEQYEAAFEVNLDYLMSVNTIDDLYSVYWTRRNLDFSYILFDWQYRMFCDAIYFYRPLYWDAGYWHFRIYTRYPHRNYFYFGRPHFWTVYRGGHSWHKNGGRSWYHGRNFSGPKAGKRPDGMRDRFDRGDFKKPNVNDGRKGRGDFNKPNVNDGRKGRGDFNKPGGNDGRKGRGDRPSSTRTTATRQATTTNAGQHVQSATDRQNDRTPNNTFTPNSRTTKTQSTTSSSTRTTRPTMSTTPATRRESTGTNVGSSISRSTRATSNSGSTTSRSTITPSRSTSSISRSSSSTNRSSANSSRSNGGSSRGRR